MFQSLPVPLKFDCSSFPSLNVTNDFLVVLFYGYFSALIKAAFLLVIHSINNSLPGIFLSLTFVTPLSPSSLYGSLSLIWRLHFLQTIPQILESVPRFSPLTNYLCPLSREFHQPHTVSPFYISLPLTHKLISTISPLPISTFTYLKQQTQTHFSSYTSSQFSSSTQFFYDL